MKLQGKLFSLITVFTLTFIANVANSHDGHKNEDIILKDLGNLGKVNFAISCDTETQKAFNIGVGLLHHMMYAQAEQLFQKSIEQQPNCAMLYWGYSMSLFHPLWPDRITEEALTKGQLALTTAQKTHKTQREKAYITTAEKYYKDWKETSEKARIKAWANAHTKLYKDYPNDIDATAFYALSQLVVASKKDKTFSTNKKVGEILSTIIDTHPLHPGAIHYSIHAYDNPKHAKLGLKSARAYDKIAPDVPHALHMPTHVFVRLGEWQDAINWNSRSAIAALKYPTKGATSMHYVHALDYKIYGLLQLGEKQQAQKVLQEIEPHHPIQNTFPAAYALSSMPARIHLEQKDWLQASQLKVRTPNYISWDKFPQVEAITYFARGIGSARNNNLPSAKENLEMLEQLYIKTQTISPNYWAVLVDAQRKSVEAWIYFSQGEKQRALTLLKEAAFIEESVDKNPVTPGTVLPIRELLGDMYILTGDIKAAKKAYSTSLTNAPKRRYSNQALRISKS
jgi:tetratricopeptide (TPR) repeat protein